MGCEARKSNSDPVQYLALARNIRCATAPHIGRPHAKNRPSRTPTGPRLRRPCVGPPTLEPPASLNRTFPAEPRIPTLDAFNRRTATGEPDRSAFVRPRNRSTRPAHWTALTLRKTAAINARGHSLRKSPAESGAPWHHARAREVCPSWSRVVARTRRAAAWSMYCLGASVARRRADRDLARGMCSPGRAWQHRLLEGFVAGCSDAGGASSRRRRGLGHVHHACNSLALDLRFDSLARRSRRVFVTAHCLPSNCGLPGIRLPLAYSTSRGEMLRLASGTALRITRRRRRRTGWKRGYA